MVTAMPIQSQRDYVIERLKALAETPKASRNARFEICTEAIDLLEAEKPVVDLEPVWDMLHFDCNNPDHGEAYRLGARLLGYTKDTPILPKPTEVTT